MISRGTRSDEARWISDSEKSGPPLTSRHSLNSGCFEATLLLSRKAKKAAFHVFNWLRRAGPKPLPTRSHGSVQNSVPESLEISGLWLFSSLRVHSLLSQQTFTEGLIE